MNTQQKRPPHRSVARVATGLLILVTLLYVVARAYEAAYPPLVYVRAFSEAAVVGALADWFAVTALFRRPLGLPIPHTEIIPRNKERIAAGIGRFIETNFLAPETVADRLGATDLASAIARWAATPAGSALLAQRVVRMLPALFDAIEREDAKRSLREAAVARIAEVNLGAVAAEALNRIVGGGSHQALVDRGLDEFGAVLDEQEAEIRGQVAEGTPWLWRKLGMGERVADGAVVVLRELLRQVREAPQHAVRQRFDRSILEFTQRLRAGEEFGEEIAQLKQALLEHPALSGYLDLTWEELRARLLADATSADSALKAKLSELIVNLASTILNDETVRKRLNRTFRAALVELVETQRAEVGAMVADMVKQWDARTLSAKIENEIGRDLQYIRVNGTLIGGLVGLVLHFLTSALP